MTPIGKIVGVFGLDGRFKVTAETAFPERFAVGETVYIKHFPHKIRWTAWHKGQVRLKVSGVTTIEAATELIGTTIFVPAEQRPEMDEDEFYAGDLIGMDVVTTEGKAVGKVTSVLSYPAQDMLEIGESLIPVVKEFIERIDLDAKTITVKPIKGMIEPLEGE